MTYVRLYIDDDKYRIGTGFRYLLVLSIGRKWVELFCIPQLIAFKMPIGEYTKAKPMPVIGLERRLTASLRRHLAEAKRLGLSYPQRTVARALKAMRSESPQKPRARSR